MDKREKLGLPKYTLGEELVNSISHGLGGSICHFISIFAYIIL